MDAGGRVMAGLDAYPRDEQGRLILPDDVLKRFWSKVDRSGGDDACWEWVAARDGRNYGRLGIAGNRAVQAHRVSYALAKGALLDGMVVHHRCFNRPCVNPAHLEQVPRYLNPHIPAPGVKGDRSRPSDYQPIPRFRTDRIATFWSKVYKPVESEACWIWTASRNADGYGVFWDGNRRIGAHRFAYAAFCGPIPEGLFVLHRCHNGAGGCVRPDHLTVGTNSDNMQAMIQAGRGNKASGLRNGSHTHPERRARGERNGSVTHPEKVNRGEQIATGVLTEPIVREILVLHARGSANNALARQFGVSAVMIGRIINRKSWTHVV